MSAGVVTLVAPWLDAIEREMEREIAALLREVAAAEEPLLSLMAEHHRRFGAGHPDFHQIDGGHAA